MTRQPVVRCPRYGHPLAWLEVANGELVVVANVVATYSDGVDIGRSTMPAAELQEYSSHLVTARCSCDRSWRVDLVDVITGTATAVPAPPANYDPGPGKKAVPTRHRRTTRGTDRTVL